MLTTFDADELVQRALQAGAAGFLPKDTPPADIVRAVEHVPAGRRFGRWLRRRQREIAAALHLPVATVKGHVSRLLDSLDVDTCVQIALLAQVAAIAERPRRLHLDFRRNT